MFDTSFKKKKTVLFSASHSVQIFFRMFSVLVLIFLFLHQCQSKLVYVKGLFTMVMNHNSAYFNIPIKNPLYCRKKARKSRTFNR